MQSPTEFEGNEIRSAKAPRFRQEWFVYRTGGSLPCPIDSNCRLMLRLGKRCSPSIWHPVPRHGRSRRTARRPSTSTTLAELANRAAKARIVLRTAPRRRTRRTSDLLGGAARLQPARNWRACSARILERSASKWVRAKSAHSLALRALMANVAGWTVFTTEVNRFRRKLDHAQ